MEHIRHANTFRSSFSDKVVCCKNLSEYQSYKDNKRQAELAARQAAQEILSQIQSTMTVLNSQH